MVPARLRLAATAVLAWALTPILLTAAPAAPTADDGGNPVQKVRQGLDRVVSIKIDHQPLDAAIGALKEKAQINIVLDGVSIQQQLGFSPDQPPVPVDVDLQDVTVRGALRAVLAPYELTYAVIGDNVIVTTETAATLRQMRQHVSVDFDKVEFGTALRQIGRDTAANIVLDARAAEAASAKVSLRMDDVPLETAVFLLAEMANLKPVRVGNTLFVTKKEIAAELKNDPDLAAPPNAPNANLKDYNSLGQAIQGAEAPAAPVLIAPPGVPPVVPPALDPPRPSSPLQKKQVNPISTDW